MLRMDGFVYLAARSPEEAVALWHGHDDAMYVAGGTDLLPNVKHRIFRPRHVVGLAGALPSGWEERAGEVVIGAGTTLTGLSTLDALAPLLAIADGPGEPGGHHGHLGADHPHLAARVPAGPGDA